MEIFLRTQHKYLRKFTCQKYLNYLYIVPEKNDTSLCMVTAIFNVINKFTVYRSRASNNLRSTELIKIKIINLLFLAVVICLCLKFILKFIQRL